MDDGRGAEAKQEGRIKDVHGRKLEKLCDYLR